MVGFSSPCREGERAARRPAPRNPAHGRLFRVAEGCASANPSPGEARNPHTGQRPRERGPQARSYGRKRRRRVVLPRFPFCDTRASADRRPRRRSGRRPAVRGRGPLAAAPPAMRSRASLRPDACIWCIPAAPPSRNRSARSRSRAPRAARPHPKRRSERVARLDRLIDSPKGRSRRPTGALLETRRHIGNGPERQQRGGGWFRRRYRSLPQPCS